MKPELEESAAAYVLDELGPLARAAFVAQMRADPQVAALVRELETALGRRVAELPAVAVPGDLWGKIERRVASGSAGGAGGGRASGEAPLPRRKRLAWVFGWGIAATIAVSLATLAWQGVRRSQRPFVIFVGLDPRESALAEVALAERPADTDASFVQVASLAAGYWRQSAALPVKASPDAGEAAPRAFAVFDPATSQGFIAVERLPAPERGRAYRVWLVDTLSGAARAAGTLPAAAGGRGLYGFTVAPPSGAKPDNLRFLVTAELDSEPGPAQPTGEVVLGRPLGRKG
jgi:anti-sigma-K factor RskA